MRISVPFQHVLFEMLNSNRMKKQKKLSTVYQNKSEIGVRDGMILYAYRASAVDIRFSARTSHCATNVFYASVYSNV